MGQLDKYVQHLLRFEAASLTLTSNGPVVARLANGGEKASTQTIEHAMLVATVSDDAPPQCLNDLRASRPTRFAYPDGQPAVIVEVTPTPGAWRVVLRPYQHTKDALPIPGEAPPQRATVPGIAAVMVSPLRISAPAPPMAPAPPTEGAWSPGARVNPPPQQRTEAPAPSQSLQNIPVVTTFRPPASAAAGVVQVPLPSPMGITQSPHAAVLHTGLSGEVAIVPPPPAPAVVEPVGDTSRLDAMLREMTRLGASDLHLTSSRVPMMRLHGEIRALGEGAAALTHEQLRAIILPSMLPATREEYARKNDADYAYEIPGVARFRGNAFVERRGCAAVFRRIPVEIVPAENLGLSKAVMELCDLSKGLVLVTGPTGSGKSTTLAAIIDRINTARKDHIITIEDPIEFVHRNKGCLVNQREVKVHTDGFKDALRAALREDPDIVLVGEMRDLETVEIAIETAETGHLVFGTLHTRTAPSTVDRIIDQFPADRQSQIRTMLAESLKAVIAQTLCKKIGGGRVAAYEVMIVTPAVSNLIREGKTFQLYGVMQTGRERGMITLHDALLELVKTRKIEVREAMSKCLSKSEMRGLLQAAGIEVPRDLAAKE